MQPQNKYIQAQFWCAFFINRNVREQSTWEYHHCFQWGCSLLNLQPSWTCASYLCLLDKQRRCAVAFKSKHV